MCGGVDPHVRLEQEEPPWRSWWRAAGLVLLSPLSECVVPPPPLLDVQTPPSLAAAKANAPEGDAEKRPAMKGGQRGGRRALEDQRAGSGIGGRRMWRRFGQM